jgi:hypothetical protein
MMTGVELFLEVCQAHDPAAELRGMGDGQLRQVMHYCVTHGTESNVAGDVLEHAMAEIVERFMNAGGEG